MIGEILLVAGAAFTLLAGIGTLRFTDPFNSIHALGKSAVLGLLLVLAGALIELNAFGDITMLLAAGVLHLLTAPVATSLLARATYYAQGLPPGSGAVDDLAEQLALADDDAGDGDRSR